MMPPLRRIDGKEPLVSAEENKAIIRRLVEEV
jgi:hypothetical protein